MHLYRSGFAFDNPLPTPPLTQLFEQQRTEAQRLIAFYAPAIEIQLIERSDQYSDCVEEGFLRESQDALEDAAIDLVCRHADEGPWDEIEVCHVPLHGRAADLDVVVLSCAVFSGCPFGISVNEGTEPAHRILPQKRQRGLYQIGRAS